MLSLAEVLRAHWAQYERQFGAQILPSHRRAVQAILNKRLLVEEQDRRLTKRAKAVEELGEGVNIAMTLLREFARSPKVIGHDWLAELMEPPGED